MTWLEQQIVALQQQDERKLDWENLSEELVSMGISERNHFKSRFGSPGIGRKTVAYDTILARTVTQKSLSGKGSSSLAP